MPVIRTTFKFVNDVADHHVMNQLETNLKMYLDWAFLNIGGWSDVTISGATGIYSGEFDKLRPVRDPFYSDGQVWEGVRKDWVWETGVNYVDATGGGPFNPNTVGDPVVDGVIDTNYITNYPLGRIIFDTAVSTSAVVRTNYSYRNVQIYKADDAPWWRDLQFRTFRPDSDHFLRQGSGNWSILGHQRVQLPVVVLESVPRGTSLPYELGNESLIRRQDVLFHILTEDRITRNNLTDILANQSDNTLWLFNVNQIEASSAFSLTFQGDLSSPFLVYPNFLEPSGIGYRWKTCRFADASISELEGIHPNLYEGTVRMTMEVIL